MGIIVTIFFGLIFLVAIVVYNLKRAPEENKTQPPAPKNFTISIDVSHLSEGQKYKVRDYLERRGSLDITDVDLSQIDPAEHNQLYIDIILSRVVEEELKKVPKITRNYTPTSKYGQKWSPETLASPNLNEIENKSTPFFSKKVVITGKFSLFPDRNVLGNRLRGFGADIQTSISGKTDIVIYGEDAGPAKMDKVKSLNASGKAKITLISEKRLLKVLDDIDHPEHQINDDEVLFAGSNFEE